MYLTKMKNVLYKCLRPKSGTYQKVACTILNYLHCLMTFQMYVLLLNILNRSDNRESSAIILRLALFGKSWKTIFTSLYPDYVSDLLQCLLMESGHE